MAGRGGYQAPANPAPASGPGALSQRTDRGQPVRALSDAAYGEQKTYREDQLGAPMASAAASAPQGPAGAPPDLSGIVGFGEPSQRGTEPITAGAPTGAGPGMESLGLNTNQDMQNLRSLLPMFEAAASVPTAGVEFRQMVRRLRASV